jgi:hypothetical protein
MTEKSTHDLIDEAARRIANDIIADPEMSANERVKAFQVLIAYREIEAPEEPEAPPPERFDQMRDKIRAAGLVGAVATGDVLAMVGRNNGNEPAE